MGLNTAKVDRSSSGVSFEHVNCLQDNPENSVWKLNHPIFGFACNVKYCIPAIQVLALNACQTSAIGQSEMHVDGTYKDSATAPCR